MRSLTTALAFISIATLSLSSHSQTLKKDGYYIEIGHLAAKHEFDSIDAKTNGIRLTLGKDFAPNWAGEIIFSPGTSNETGSTYVGGTKINYDLKLKNIYGVYMKPKYMATQDLELFGRLGFAGVGRDMTLVNASNPADRFSGSESGSDLSYGFGMKYNLTPEVSLVADYMSFYNKSNVKINGYTVGLGYRF